VTDAAEATGEVAYVGLGSNLDDPAAQVVRAADALASLASTRELRLSRLYRTAPWGNRQQPAFVNAVAALRTTLDPFELLDALLELERAQGRVRDGQRWGPRRIDLDLLLFGQRHLDVERLVLPHPHMTERAFVLVPLADLAPDLIVPGHGALAALLGRVDRADCVAIT
jgi:2-amino-4-hydroxy-6-hydroxymethyldihydropteridine diphosphokinase